MTNPFSALPKDASLATICGAAGRVFEDRSSSNPGTEFNKEMWYLAGDALNNGFYVLQGMTQERVASTMASSVLSHVRANQQG